MPTSITINAKRIMGSFCLLNQQGLVLLLFPCVGKNFIRIVLVDKEKPNLITAFPVPPLPSLII